MNRLVDYLRGLPAAWRDFRDTLAYEARLNRHRRTSTPLRAARMVRGRFVEHDDD